MANKPIIDIDVNDSQFKAFYEMFKEYHSQIDEMPEQWEDVNDEIKKAGATLNKFSNLSQSSKDQLAASAIQAYTISNAIKAATTEQSRFNKETTTSEKRMKNIAKHSKSFAKSLFGASKLLFKIGALGAGVGSIAGLFGMRELAESAVSTQRTARGIGVTPGQLKAFGVEWKRYVNPNMLQNVAAQQASYEGRVWLSRASGMSIGQVQTARPDILAEKIAMKAHQWWKRTPPSQRTTQAMAPMGFLQSGLSLEDVRRLGAARGASLQQATTREARESRAFNVGRGTNRAWYQLARQFSVAGNAIQTEFINKLAKLGPSISRIIGALNKDIQILIGEAFTPKNMKAIASGLSDLGKYLGSKKFGDDIKKFETAIGDFANVVIAIAKWMGVSIEKGAPQPIAGLTKKKVAKSALSYAQGKIGLPALEDVTKSYLGWASAKGHAIGQSIRSELSHYMGSSSYSAESQPGSITPHTMKMINSLKGQRNKTDITIHLQDKAGAKVPVSINAVAH